MEKRSLVTTLFDIGAIKFGSFTLKSGIESPIYLDLRVIVSYPAFLETVAEAFWTLIEECPMDLICGVPYTALPIATVISVQHRIPMIMRRKEVKTYGTKKSLEGIFKPGQTCLIVEDLITSGASVLETVEPIEQEQLKVRDIAVLIDREQGGRQKLESLGYKVHALLTLTEILEILVEKQKINLQIKQSVLDFVAKAQVCS